MGNNRFLVKTGEDKFVNAEVFFNLYTCIHVCKLIHQETVL